MTSPISTLGLTYDGSDLQNSDLSLFLRIVRGFWETPRVRGDDFIVPAAQGRSEGVRINDILTIELRGTVQSVPGLGSADAMIDSFQENMLAMRAIFAPDRLRADLVATLRDGTTRTISARPMNIIANERINGYVADVSIELEGYGDWDVEGS